MPLLQRIATVRVKAGTVEPISLKRAWKDAKAGSTFFLLEVE